MRLKPYGRLPSRSHHRGSVRFHLRTSPTERKEFRINGLKSSDGDGSGSEPSLSACEADRRPEPLRPRRGVRVPRWRDGPRTGSSPRTSRCAGRSARYERVCLLLHARRPIRAIWAENVGRSRRSPRKRMPTLADFPAMRSTPRWTGSSTPSSISSITPGSNAKRMACTKFPVTATSTNATAALMLQYSRRSVTIMAPCASLASISPSNCKAVQMVSWAKRRTIHRPGFRDFSSLNYFGRFNNCLKRQDRCSSLSDPSFVTRSRCDGRLIVAGRPQRP